MALTYGFYNSIEGDRVYDAIQFGRIFDGIIKDGVYATYEKGMMVIASSNPAEVIIQPGRAWFNHTWSYNDANVIFEAPAPEVLLERIDALVLEINEEISSRENSYKWVQGTPSSRPERPTLTNTTTIHQYPLCYVHRYPETTMIYTRDITNMVGTSECPFATGVLEGIDLDAWINQWDDEFHTWENSKKTQFEAWMLSQETAFTTWYNAFKNQMASDVQEVEDFVDYLKTVLDESTAVHLQEEIDDLRNEISSGSHITVTTINPELYGRNVTITEAGGTVFTEKFDNTGVAVFKSVPYVGNLTISSTYGTQTAERVVNTPYYARYEFAIAFWAATVNIVGDPEMAGSSVTVKDSDSTIVGTVVLDSEGTGVYTAIKPDTYKFILTYGGETMEVTLSVTQETTYTVDLHAAGFKWQDWLEAGGVTGSYSSLDDVLEDEVALRRLFTVHASVDYMAGIDKENENVEKIIVTDLAAKWINLRDYALDTLYANTIIKGYMDTADKYFYGEWVITDNTTTPPTWGAKGNVPVMTSNTAPYGTAGGDAESTSYLAFDGNDSTAASKAGLPTSAIVWYKFPTPTEIKRADFLINFATAPSSISAQVIYSDDASTWHDATQAVTVSNNVKKQIDVEPQGYHLYWGIRRILSESKSGAGNTIQFYGRELSVSVPKMDTNTTPYGVASASSEAATSSISYAAYQAFSSDSAHGWVPTGGQYTTSDYLRYQFVSPIIAKQAHVVFMPYNQTRSFKYKIQGSNTANSNDWIDVSDEIQLTAPSGGIYEANISLTSSQEYLYYQFIPTTSDMTLNAFGLKLQLYGLDYSEKEFEEGATKKWLYDHGVELETINVVGTVTKGTDAIQLTAANAQATASVNTTAYSLVRGKVGAHASGTNQLICGSGASNFTANNMPYNNGFDVSSVNGSNAVGVKQTAVGIFDATELWLE